MVTAEPSISTKGSLVTPTCETAERAAASLCSNFEAGSQECGRPNASEYARKKSSLTDWKEGRKEGKRFTAVKVDVTEGGREEKKCRL